MTRQKLAILGTLALGISSAFAQSAGTGTVNVIVHFRTSPDHAGFQRFLNHGAQHHRDFTSIGASLFTINSRDLNLLVSRTPMSLEHRPPDSLHGLQRRTTDDGRA